ncbi:hypothetical protein OSTOST_14560 [Ostertagia ostertagi]
MSRRKTIQRTLVLVEPHSLSYKQRQNGGASWRKQPGRLRLEQLANDPTHRYTSKISNKSAEPDCHPAISSETTPSSTPLLNTFRFSTWTSLLQIVFLILRFLTIISPRQLHSSAATMLYYAQEPILFRFAQSQNPPSPELIRQLHLFKCPHLWRSQGRINNSSLHQDTITPIFLSSTNRITGLFILHTHSESGHCGLNHTLTQLRQRVWIPQGRTTAKRVPRNVVSTANTFFPSSIPTSSFPSSYATTIPFPKCRHGLFGPTLYRNFDATSSRYWVLLLTCLNTRAIYVDTILDMTSLKVLHVLRRFIATIGCPDFILCDNAPIAKCYLSLPNPDVDNDILDYCTKRQLQIKFIPSLSPWQGGVCEEIDIFKKSFTHTVRNRLLSIEVETEAKVNTRPITYITDDIDHIPLRPIDFLRPYAQLAGPSLQDDSDEWIHIPSTRESLLSGNDCPQNTSFRYGSNTKMNTPSRDHMKCSRQNKEILYLSMTLSSIVTSGRWEKSSDLKTTFNDQSKYDFHRKQSLRATIIWSAN